MLSKGLNLIALKHGAELAEEGKEVTSDFGGMFNKLYRVTGEPFTHLHGEDGLPDIESQAVELEYLNDPKRNLVHADHQNEAVNILTNALIRTMDISKTIVIEQIALFKEDLEERLTKFDNVNISDNFDIVEKCLPEPLENSLILINYEKYKDTKRAGFSNINLKDIDIDVKSIKASLIDYTKSKDGKMVTWLERMDLEDVLHSVLSGVLAGADSGFFDRKFSSMDAFQQLNFFTATFLIAKFYRDNPPNANLGIGLDEYTKYLNAVIGYAGAACALSVNRISRISESGRIIVSENLDKKSISVFKPLYRNWLEGAGTVEALLGRLTSGEVLVTREKELTPKVIDYTSMWSKYTTLSKANMQSRKLEVFKTLAKSSFKHILNENLTDLEKKEGRGAEVTNACKIAGEIIAEATLDDLVNLDEFTMCVITKARFPFTASYENLSYMYKAQQNNSDTSPQEAAFFALIEHLADYLAGELKVVPI